MTNITDLARKANLIFPGTDCVDGDIKQLERFAALYRAAIIEELTGEMPEPDTYGLPDFVTKSDKPLYTLKTMREYAAGLVAKAVAAERETQHGDINVVDLTAARDALKAEVERLTADARRYQAIRNGLEVEPDNSGIVVSLIDDFGGETLHGEKADAAIDEAMK